MDKPDQQVLLVSEAVALEATGEPMESIERMISPAAINNATLTAYTELRAALVERSGLDRDAEAHAPELEPGGDLHTLNVIAGVGLGLVEDADELGPGLAEDAGEIGFGAACLEVYTTEPLSRQNAADMVAATLGVTTLDFDEVSIRVVNTGPIDLQPHRFRQRPAPGGISIGHYNVTAGTLGCLCIGRSDPRNQRTLVLSNNHVLANVNAGRAGDTIYQPGRSDAGLSDEGVLGYLERFVKISFKAENQVDCATAWVEKAAVRPELVYLRDGQRRYFRVTKHTSPARVGMRVGKSGRTTQLTVGEVSAVGVVLPNVRMSNGRGAVFVDQVAIRGLHGRDFSQPGDSGSLIWTWDEGNPTGLLFAGTSGGREKRTFANRIDTVLNALDVDLVVV